MGCGASRENSNQNARMKTRNGNNQKNKNTHLLEPTIASMKEITTIREFKINLPDLVVTKKGKIQSEYTLLNPVLGKGENSEVRRAIHKLTNIMRAVKIIYKYLINVEDQQTFIDEISILRTLDHPNIMKIIEFFEDDQYFYIISEFYTGGQLHDHILKKNKFNEQQAASVMKQILSAIYYCHQRDIAHHALKPENILYETKRDNSLLKIIDFGPSKTMQTQLKINQAFGISCYIAPEILKMKYNKKCDIWSCGVILYVLLSGELPFKGNTEKELANKIKAAKYDFNNNNWQIVSDDAKKFISRMLEKDAGVRYSAEDALNDSWIKKWVTPHEIDRPLARRTLINLKNFNTERKLQEATWVYLVTYMANKEEKYELLKIFQALDSNGDGHLTCEELIEGYNKLMGSDEAELEVDKIMETVDRNNSGGIDYTEFIIATMNKKNFLSKERLEAMFKMLDKDCNGYITYGDLQEAFNPHGNKDITERIWLDMIEEVDTNFDGQISFKEFKEMMMKFQ